MRTFVTTDTHGCFKEFRQVLDAAQFKYDEDILIHLGDCTDRGPCSFHVIEELLKIKNLIAVRGNHDEYIRNFINTGYHPWEHGSYKTVLSYVQALELTYEEVHVNQKMSGISTNFEPRHMPKSHRDFFINQIDYYIDKDNRLFVHGGYDPLEPFEQQTRMTFLWDRELIERQAYYLEMGSEPEKYPDVNDFKRVFIGHTPTIIFKMSVDKLSPIWLPGGVPFTEPMYMGQLVDLDTGCCFGNKLSLIDISDDENHILYQSDLFKAV
jgi:serine/threonine protein phosphatase 1